jgi:hypothetical protein
MTKSELKKVIKECLLENSSLMEEPTKYGTERHTLEFTKDFKDALGTVHKAGSTTSIDGHDNEYAWAVAGHGLTIDYPLTHAKVVTTQTQLPDKLHKQLIHAKESLSRVLKSKETYYSDVFPQEEAEKFIKDAIEILTKIKSTKGHVRK